MTRDRRSPAPNGRNGNRNGAAPPVNLDIRRHLDQLVGEGFASSGIIDVFRDDVLVRQGEVYQEPCAFLVYRGELLEIITCYQESGHIDVTAAKICPGGIAFIQALSPQYATQPAFTTIKAVDDGQVVLISSDLSRDFGAHGLLLSSEIAIRLQMLTALAEFSARCKPPERKQTMERLLADLEEERADAARAREMMRKAVEALEEERARLARRALGAEMFLGRLRKLAAGAGITDQELELTPDELRFIRGEPSANLLTMSQAARGSGQDIPPISGSLIEGLIDDARMPPSRPPASSPGRISWPNPIAARSIFGTPASPPEDDPGADRAPEVSTSDELHRTMRFGVPLSDKK